MLEILCWSCRGPAGRFAGLLCWRFFAGVLGAPAGRFAGLLRWRFFAGVVGDPAGQFAGLLCWGFFAGAVRGPAGRSDNFWHVLQKNILSRHK